MNRRPKIPCGSGATATVVCRRAVSLLVLIVLTLGAAGCMKSQALESGKMDTLYQVSPNVWPQAVPPKIDVAGFAVPTSLVLTRERDLFASVMDIINARKRMDGGETTFRVLLADQLTDRMADVLWDLSRRTKQWGESSEKYSKPYGRDDWAADTAGLLTLLYRLDRGETATDPREAFHPTQSQLASLAPVLRSLLMMLMKRLEFDPGEGGLMAGLESQRSLPIEFVLRGSFRLARLQMPPQAPAEVQAVFDHGPPTALGVENVLREKLLDLRKQAERGTKLTGNKNLELAMKSIPIVLANLARGMEQWGKFYLAAVEVGEVNGDEMISLVADVQPGEVVRIDQVHAMAPLLTFQGRTRVNLRKAPGQGDGAERMSARFVDERSGQVCVRFESGIYGVASLLAFPIEDWVLDEMVVTQSQPERHRKETDVVLLMRTREWKEGQDRRRVMRVHTVRTLEVTTSGETVDRRVRTDLRFEFSRADRMWYYDRTSYTPLAKP
jgi:hypothetical protein